jgi:hypothetical protein
MYASLVSLLRLPPLRRRENRGKFAPAVRGLPPELHLRGVDARRSHSGGFWRSKRAGVPRKHLLAVYKFMDEKGPLSAEHMTLKNAHVLLLHVSLLLGGGRRKSNTGEAYIC